MSKNSDFLAEVYRGAKMGAHTLDSLISKTQVRSIKDELMREKQAYREFQGKALRELKKRHEKPKPINQMQKSMAKVGIFMNTMMDKSPSHIADIVIQGNNMGIIGMTKTINHHKLCDEEITDLANELVNIQEQNIENLKKFL